jgi:hypothetical protein
VSERPKKCRAFFFGDTEKGLTSKFVGKEDLFNTKVQRDKGSKVGRNLFEPLSL